MKEAKIEGARAINDPHFPAPPPALLHMGFDHFAEHQILLIASEFSERCIACATLPTERQVQQQIEACRDFKAGELPTRRLADTAQLGDRSLLKGKEVNRTLP